MDFSTVVGVLITVVLVFMAMGTGGNLGLFWDQPSMLMVGGGTIGVTLVCFTAGDLKQIFKILVKSFVYKLPSHTEEIERILAYATLARKEGLLALENKLQEVDDRFFAKGVQLVIDGFPAETVRDIMELEADWQRQRHALGKKMMETMATYAPAFGMIGTLVGLVQMLANLSDPSSIGAGMAVALLTTMYGAMMANMLFLPFAAKLDVRAKQEAQLRDLMIEGLVAIQSGEKPQLIKEKLKGFLSPAARASIGT
jgi:chemotaxis protein MotA